MTRIVFLDRATIGPTVKMARPSFPHQWIEYDQTDETEAAARLAGAELAVINKVPMRPEILDACPDLKFIAVAATGYDVIDIAACKERGIVVSNIRGYAANAVPEHTFAMILALRRALVSYRQDVINGRWQESGQFCFFDHRINDLSGATLGVIGSGAIGGSVARIGEAFGMRVLLAGRKGRTDVAAPYTPFEQVLEQADVLTLHCPLRPETRGLISDAEFARMKRRPILINTARGGLVDEADLVRALDAGQISGAGFDCLTSEPPADDNPLLAILGRPNVIVTPHVGWASDEAMQTLWDQVVANLENFVAGNPTNVIE